jgi:hypothetical protein
MDTVTLLLAPLACNLDWSICILCLRCFVGAAAHRLFGRAPNHVGCNGAGEIAE